MKESQNKGLFQGKHLEINQKKQKGPIKTKLTTGNAKSRPTRPKEFCAGMRAQLHSPIMQQVLLFTRAGFFHDNTCKKSL